ncbi:hypothetical protein JXA56_01090 [Candidatus Micrarchaeota archaeon]|nr:hypothetical protein [Candidatus Micrarchaeota archaeon]
MKGIIFLLLLTAAVSAGLDQFYEQKVLISGESVVEKTMDISLFSDDEALAKVEQVCSQKEYCSLDNKTITITEKFAPGPYYQYNDNYGLFIEYEITVKRIPTDKFSRSLDSILKEAGAIDEIGSAAEPLDLLDKEANRKSAEFLRKFNVNIVYAIDMPAEISEARAGNVSGKIEGSRATFDIIEIMQDSDVIVVKSSQINMGYIITVTGIASLAVLAILFTRKKK